jgi:hypothetical protein
VCVSRKTLTTLKIDGTSIEYPLSHLILTFPETLIVIKHEHKLLHIVTFPITQNT